MDKTKKAILAVSYGSSLAAAREKTIDIIEKKLADELKRQKLENVLIGTIDGAPGFVFIPETLRRIKPGKVILMPFLLTAGSHVIREMSSDREGSWKNRLEAEGFQVKAIPKGLAEYEEIRQIFVKHALEVVKMRQPFTDKNRIGKSIFLPALLAALLLSLWLPTDVQAAPGYDKVANAADTGGTTEVGKYGMLPVYGKDIKDGVYTITGESSSSFFRIEESELTVKDGVMTVAMKVPSTSYKFVYMGTAEEAAAAPLEDYIEPSNKVGMSVYEIPVEALDEGIQCAAYSKRKKKWFDRTILFHASDIPAEALSVTLPDYDKIEEALKLYEQTNGTGVTDGTSAANGSAENVTDGSGAQTGDVAGNTAGSSGTQTGDASGSESGSGAKADASSDQNAAGQAAEGNGTQAAEPVPVDINLDDGTYSIQVNMTGGSGRASVSSPTWLIVKGHKAYAKLLWSSSYYDYMLVGGKKYLNESEDGGNSTFTIPITYMDEAMEVVADTTAMGDPVAIDYRLTFYEDSVGSKSQIPQEAAIDVLILAAIIIVVGGILNYFVKKRRKH